jgi:hypothetical protein
MKKQLAGFCRVIIIALLSPGLLAQTTTGSIWDQMELTGHHYKILGTPVFHKDKKTVPIWIPVTGGVIAGGVITWLILKDDGGTPSTGPPVANGDSFTVPCGQTSGTIEVLSNDSGEGISITSATGPAGVSVTIAGSSLEISGIGASSLTVSYTITDTEGRMAIAKVQVHISDSEPPTITCPETATVNCGGDTTPTLTGTATATDVCAGSELTINFTDDNSGQTGCNNTGTLIRTWTANDPAGNTSQCAQTINIAPDETPPSITCPGTVTVQCGDGTNPSLTGFPTGEDNCGPTPVFSFIDDESGLTECNNTGAIERAWTAEDGCGLQQSCTQTITVEDTSPPAITCPAATTVECDGSMEPFVTGTATAEDACGLELTINHEDDASGLTGCSGTGDLTRTWTATDACGNEQTCTQIITVADQTPPEVTCPEPTTVTCTGPLDPTVTGTPTYTDNCSGTFTTGFEDDDSGVVNCSGDLLRTWTVTDECGNEQNCTQTITIIEANPPVVTCPGDVTIQCSDSSDPTNTGDASVDYSCGSATTGTLDFADDTSGLSGCNGTGTIVRTWTATDSCGAEGNCTQTITLVDTTVPAITCPANTAAVCMEPNDPAITGEPVVSDNCTANPETTFEDDGSGVVNCSGDLLRIWTVTDACGNANVCVQTITITPPPCTFTVTFDISDAHCGVADGIAVANVSPPSGNYTYAWSNGATGPVLTDVPAAAYSVTITDVALGCFLTFPATIGEQPAQYVSNVQVQPADCPNGGDIIFTVMSPGSGPINIDVGGPPGNFIIPNVPNGATVNLQAFANIVPGQYVIQVNDASTGPACTEVFSVNVDQAPPYTLQVIQVNPPSSPSNNDGSIVVQVTGPGSHPPPYLIFLNGNPIGTSNDPIIFIQNLQAGIYNIQVFDAFECPSEVVTVILEPMLNLEIKVPQNFTTPPLPDLTTSGSIEHPLKEIWQPTDYVPFEWQAIEFSGQLQRGLEWRFGMAHSQGLGIFQNPRFPALLSIGMQSWSAMQELSRPAAFSGGKIRMGAGLYQHYFTINDVNAMPSGFLDVKFENPLRLGFMLTSSVEFDIGERLRYELPLSLQLEPSGGTNIWFGSKMVFRM